MKKDEVSFVMIPLFSNFANSSALEFILTLYHMFVDYSIEQIKKVEDDRDINKFDDEKEGFSNVKTTKSHKFEEMRRMMLEIIAHNRNHSLVGDVAEFGCYTGISTAKLSIVANFLGKKLYAFDSFEGLPIPEIYGTGWQRNHYEAGKYSADLELAVRNVRTFGCIQSVEFYKGWFKDVLTLFDKDIKLSYVFIDVDLSKSLDEVLEFVLPRLTKKGLIFCHEARDFEMTKIYDKHGMMDNARWESLGVGTGLSNDMDNLCVFMMKG